MSVSVYPSKRPPSRMPGPTRGSRSDDQVRGQVGGGPPLAERRLVRAEPSSRSLSSCRSRRSRSDAMAGRLRPPRRARRLSVGPGGCQDGRHGTTSRNRDRRVDDLHAHVRHRQGRRSSRTSIPASRPITVNHFVVNARNGFYDGLTFHRVVPGFVIQGGDPEGTGRGGPGYQLRRRAGEGRVHRRARWRWPTPGRTPTARSSSSASTTAAASSQPLYNLFGYVTEGMDVAKSIEVGDKIKSVTVTERPSTDPGSGGSGRSVTLPARSTAVGRRGLGSLRGPTVRSPAMELNLAAAHEALAEALGDRACLIAGDRELTWADVNDRTRRLANVLLDHGIGLRRPLDGLDGWASPHDHVGLYLLNGNEYLEGMLGAAKARAAAFNVNYRYVADELAYVFDDADAAAIVYHGRYAAHARRGAPAARQRAPLLLRVDDGSGDDLLPGAIDYEEALAAASPARPDRRLVARRPVRRLHRRHDRRPEGRPVAPGRLPRRRPRRHAARRLRPRVPRRAGRPGSSPVARARSPLPRSCTAPPLERDQRLDRRRHGRHPGPIPTASTPPTCSTPASATR